MEEKDREMLIRVHENVGQIKEYLPKLSQKVEKHDKFIWTLGLALGGVWATFLAAISGGWFKK